MGIERTALLWAGLIWLALPAIGQDQAVCPAGAHECACDDPTGRQGDQCGAAAERVAWLMTADNRDLISGRAAGDHRDLRAHALATIAAPDRLARMLIGLWQAQRGYYTRARHISQVDTATADDLALYDFGRRLGTLGERAQLLTDDTVSLVLVRGTFSGNTARLMPATILGRLMRAHHALKSGDMEAALADFERAERDSHDQALFAEARLYLAQSPELGQPGQDDLARGYAALTLGLHLTAGPDPLATARVLTEAASLLQRQGRTAEAEAAYELIEAVREADLGRLGTLEFGVYDAASSAEIMLDALDYGGGDGRRALHYLELARNATPHDPAIRQALALVSALAHGGHD